MKRLRSILFLFSLLGSLFPLNLWAADSRTDRAAWMREARWGVMTHYLADWIARDADKPMTVERWNQLVDEFDVETLADQLKSVGAGYYLITTGQSSGYYLSPNATYDRLVGIDPSKCSRRDLVADLHTALEKRGIKLMVYLLSRAPRRDPEAVAALGYEHPPGRNVEFQLKWEAVIREWSERWGDKIAAWWFDGVYWPNTMHRHADAPNFESFAAAARAGNPDAAVSFNPGVVNRPISMTPVEDYIAGEVNKPELWSLNPSSAEGRSDGAQIHVLTFLGEYWGRGKPRFAAGEEIAFALKINEAGGALTWDVPPQIDGTIAPEYLAQLRGIGEALKKQ